MTHHCFVWVWGHGWSVRFGKEVSLFSNSTQLPIPNMNLCTVLNQKLAISVCPDVYVTVGTCVCIYIYIYLFIYLFICLCTHTHTYNIHMNACMHACMNACKVVVQAEGFEPEKLCFIEFSHTF